MYFFISEVKISLQMSKFPGNHVREFRHADFTCMLIWVLHCSVGYYVENAKFALHATVFIIVDDNLCTQLESFHKGKFLWENTLFRQLQVEEKNSNFKNFKGTLYMKCVSIPLLLLWYLLSQWLRKRKAVYVLIIILTRYNSIMSMYLV